MQHALHRDLLSLLGKLLIAALRARLSRCGEKDLDRRVGQDDRADVAAVHQDISVFRHVALGVQQKFAHLGYGRHAGGIIGDLRRADLARNVLAVQQHMLRAVFIGDADADVRQDRPDALGILAGNAPAADRETDGAVHRARIDIDVAKLRRRGARHGGFSGTRRAVDRNRNVFHACSSSCAADRPARRPVDHAICRLKPPV